MGMWLTQIIYSIVKNFHERFKFLNLKIRRVMRIKILNSCLYRTITFKQLDVFKNIFFYMRLREDTSFILSLQFFLIEFDILMLTTHILNWHCRWPCLSICFFFTIPQNALKSFLCTVYFQFFVDVLKRLRTIPY